MASISVDLPLAPSLNNAYGNSRGPRGGRFPTRAHVDWKVAAGWELNCADVGRISGRYRLTVLLPEGMRGDVSNRAKLPEDLLVKHGVIPDDRNAVSVSARRDPSVRHGRCVVIVEAVE